MNWDEIKELCGTDLIHWYEEVEYWGLQADVCEQFNQFYKIVTDDPIIALDLAMEEWDI